MIMLVLRAVDAFLPMRDIAFRYPAQDVRWPCMAIKPIPHIFMSI